MATHFSTLAWKKPWTEEPGRLQSLGLQRVGHDRATSFPFLSFSKVKDYLNLRGTGQWPGVISFPVLERPFVF